MQAGANAHAASNRGSPGTCLMVPRDKYATRCNDCGKSTVGMKKRDSPANRGSGLLSGRTPP
eukprot:3914184-Lingulodinium_polyedra.AAC.1